MRSAGPERRRLFGRRLRERREDGLGFTERKGGRRAFEGATGWDTRNAFDIENAKRANFKEETLRKGMRAYQLTRTSARAFLLGETDELVPADPPVPPAGEAARLGLPPMADPDPGIWPHVRAISNRLFDLAARRSVHAGDIPGELLFPHDPRNAARWDDDGLRRAFSVSDRVYIIAEVLRTEADAARSSRAG